MTHVAGHLAERPTTPGELRKELQSRGAAQEIQCHDPRMRSECFETAALGQVPPEEPFVVDRFFERRFRVTDLFAGQ